MIKELVQFVEHLDPMLKNKGVEPKEGLHIVITLKDTEGVTVSEPVLFRSGKTEMKVPFIDFAAKTQLAWNVNTNKCFDLPAKGVHSCSPFVVAFKKESLEGGDKYAKDKVKIYDRFEQFYFPKALKLLEEDKDTLEKATRFARFMYNRQLWESPLRNLQTFKDLKDKDYIVFYLDVEMAFYEAANKKYLKENLFNTNFYNETTKGNAGKEILNGTSDFFNGYNSKKPFLMHQTSGFDITGRITESEARGLFEFQKIIRRGFLPRPLPIFIDKNELEQGVKLFKDENTKQTYRGIIDGFKKANKEVHNYYLLFYLADEIRDFDFVSKFEYDLLDTEGEKWQIKKLMKVGEFFKIDDVFAFQDMILPVIFNNSLIVKSGKTDTILYKYFEDIEQKYCDNNNANVFNLVIKYRKAFYDFIYKSRRSAINGAMFKDIMQTVILSDIRRDEDYKSTYRICHKLNIYFSLNPYFDNQNKNFNNHNMASKIPDLMNRIRKVANEPDVNFDNPEDFAFAAGQVVFFLFTKSKTDNKTHALLEPFIQKPSIKLLRDEINKTYHRYMYDLSFGKGRVERLMREINGYTETESVKEILPFFLAGYFAESIIFESTNS